MKCGNENIQIYNLRWLNNGLNQGLRKSILKTNADKN